MAHKPLASLDPGKIVCALASGGSCLADVGLLRAEPGVFGPVASDPTVSRLVSVLAADTPKALTAIGAARASAGDHARGHGIDTGHPLVIDLVADLPLRSLTFHRGRRPPRSTRSDATILLRALAAGL